jgi:transposase
MEISYRKGHKYLLVVVDHDTGRLVWVAKGADKATLGWFFDLLGPDRGAAITHVSSDGARPMSDVIAAHRPRAVRCAGPYHVVTSATEALDEQRRQAWNAARGAARGASRYTSPTGVTKMVAAPARVRPDRYRRAEGSQPHAGPMFRTQR